MISSRLNKNIPLIYQVVLVVIYLVGMIGFSNPEWKEELQPASGIILYISTFIIALASKNKLKFIIFMAIAFIIGFGTEAIGVNTGSATMAIIGGAVGGMLMALIFGVLTLNLLANQVASGLALTLFGLGLSALIGHAYVGKTFPGLPKLDIPVLSDIPLVGPLIFGQDFLVYFSVASVVFVGWFLKLIEL